MTTHCEFNPQLIRNANEKFHQSKKDKYQIDKLRQDKPWELWEFCDQEYGNQFKPCEDEPLWWEKYQYRHINPQEEPKPLEHYGKMLVIVRKNIDGEYEGFVENSFSLGWLKNFCYVYTSTTMYSILGSHQLNAVNDVDKQIAKFTQQITTTKEYALVANRVSKMKRTVERSCKDSVQRAKLLKHINNILPTYVEKNKNWEIYDPTSPDCPIKINLQAWTLARSNRNSRNFDCRNARFSTL